jgi:hypothetical protein
VRVLQGSAFELDRALPYGPIADLLPGVATWVPTNADSSIDQNQQLLQGLLLAFDRLIARGPTLVVVEDIHWAD